MTDAPVTDRHREIAREVFVVVMKGRNGVWSKGMAEDAIAAALAQIEAEAMKQAISAIDKLEATLAAEQLGHDVEFEQLSSQLAAAEERGAERLAAALRRIDSINDNPARYNSEINAVIEAALSPPPSGDAS